MTTIKQRWRAWVELTSRREPATALVFVRISAALVLLCDQLWLWHLGVVDDMWSRYPAGYASYYSGWADSLGLDATELWALAVAALACVLLGVATRVACAAFVIVSAQMAAICPNGESAIDVLMRVVFAILALSRCDAQWSVDAWLMRRLGRPMPALVPAWPRYLLLLQLLWVYFSSGHNKSSAVWGPHGGFTALANALLDPINGRLSPAFIGAIYPVTRVATALTMLFEITAPLYLLWLYYAATPDRPGRLRAFANRWRVRWIWLALGIVFELGIAIGLKLGAFPFGMLALFWVLLLPDELQRRNTPGPAKRASSPS